MRCDRCKKRLDSFTMSFFCEEIICFECETKERAHPDYERARKAEGDAVRAGDYNFPGIGKPSDL